MNRDSENEALEATRQWVMAAAAMSQPLPQTGFFPQHPPPAWPGFSQEAAAAWFASLAQNGGTLPLHLQYAAGLPQMPAAPLDRWPAAARSLLQLQQQLQQQQNRAWPPQLLTAPSLLMPGLPWQGYHHHLLSSTASQNPRVTTPSGDSRIGRGQSPAMTIETERALSRDRTSHEPLLLGSSRQTYRTAGLHAFAPYSKPSAPVPLSSTVASEACLDLSMPRLAGDERARGPVRVSTPVATSPSLTVAGSHMVTVPRPSPKLERENTSSSSNSKKAPIPVGIAVAWQRRQDGPMDQGMRADASSQPLGQACHDKPGVPLEETHSTAVPAELVPAQQPLMPNVPLPSPPFESVIKTHHRISTKEVFIDSMQDPLQRTDLMQMPAKVIATTSCPTTPGAPDVQEQAPECAASSSGLTVADLHPKLQVECDKQEAAVITHTSVVTGGKRTADVWQSETAFSTLEHDRVMAPVDASPLARPVADSLPGVSGDSIPAGGCKNVPGVNGTSADGNCPKQTDSCGYADVHAAGSMASAVLKERPKDTRRAAAIAAAARVGQTTSRVSGAAATALAAVPSSSAKRRRSQNPKKKKKAAAAQDIIIPYRGVDYRVGQGNKALSELERRIKERIRALDRSIQSNSARLAKLEAEGESECSRASSSCLSTTGDASKDNAAKTSSVSTSTLVDQPGPSGTASAQHRDEANQRTVRKRQQTTGTGGQAIASSIPVSPLSLPHTPLPDWHSAEEWNEAMQDASAAAPDLRTTAEDLIEGARLLVFIGGLPHEAVVVCIEPPSVYGVRLAGQRSARPRVYARDDLLQDSYRDVQPASVTALLPGSRVCAYWSNQFGYLYPGVVTAICSGTSGVGAGGGGQQRSSRASSVSSRQHVAAASPGTGLGLSPLVDITFDDGDSGKFPLEQIRLLPPDFPHTPIQHQQSYDDELSVVPLERRRSTAGRAAPSSSLCSPAVSAAGSCDEICIKQEPRDEGPGQQCLNPSGSSACTAADVNAVEEADVFEDSDDEPLQVYKAKRSRDSLSPSGQKWEWVGPATRRRDSLSTSSGHGRHRGREHKDFYKELRRGEETLKIGDCAVFIRREEDKPPYVGKIISMWQGCRSHRRAVRVQWFYHPEETRDARAVNEDGSIPEDLIGALFESEHVDENSVHTISHRCEVLPLADYQDRGLHLRPLMQLMQHTAFYVAGAYDATGGRITSLLRPGTAQ